MQDFVPIGQEIHKILESTAGRGRKGKPILGIGLYCYEKKLLAIPE